MMKDNVPAPSYSFFINKLLNTIRDEIASCMEKAYEGISLTECSKMLQLDAAATKQLIAQRKWSVDPKSQRVSFTDGSEKKLAEEIATEELAKMSITYAREMEQIV